jgi:IS5 family transposase
MKQTHDTQIGWQFLNEIFTGSKRSPLTKETTGPNSPKYLREEGVRPVIKHHEFASLDGARNARIDDETYHRRSVVESVFASLRCRFDDTIRARIWYGQFREFVLKAAINKIEDAIKL